MTASIPFATRTQLRHLPGRAGLPFVGVTLEYFKDPIGLARRRYEAHGPVDWSTGFGLTIVGMFGPEANQLLYQNKGDIFSSELAWEFFLAKFFHRGIMLLDAEEHRWHRRLMQSAFTKPAMSSYAEQMTPTIIKEVKNWPVDSPGRMFERLKALTLNIGTDVFIGEANCPEVDKMNQSFLATVRAPTDLFRLPIPGTRWWKGLRGRQFLEQYFYGLLPKKRAEDGDDLLSRLCAAKSDDGHQFEDEDVVNHIIFVLMAAHDTATITLGNMMYQLGKHPEWQERLRQECIGLDKAAIDYDDLPKLEQMTLVFKEVLRLIPPVPQMPRVALRPFEFNGQQIPAGAFLQTTPIFSHYMPEYWQDPHRFDPERFAPPREEHKQHPFLWVPFGGGAHKCIGMHFGELEVKAIMYQILKNFRWQLPVDYEMPQDWLSLPIPKDGLPIRLERL